MKMLQHLLGGFIDFFPPLPGFSFSPTHSQLFFVRRGGEEGRERKAKENSRNIWMIVAI
jgi:hypothetical protein